MATRKFSRVNFKVSATITVAKHQFQGSVENLSMNGMFLITSERLAIGDAVEITIYLTGSDPEISVGFSGRTSRVTNEGLGFTFEKIDLDSYTHLKNIVTYNMIDSEKVLEEIHQSLDEKLSGK